MTTIGAGKKGAVHLERLRGKAVEERVAPVAEEQPALPVVEANEPTAEIVAAARTQVNGFVDYGTSGWSGATGTPEKQGAYLGPFRFDPRFDGSQQPQPTYELALERFFERLQPEGYELRFMFKTGDDRGQARDLGRAPRHRRARPRPRRPGSLPPRSR